jgi:soluble lytic murein transglycosylase
MRVERWDDAARLIDAEPEATRSIPAMRYARARAALGVGDGPRAKALLEGLDEKLPAIAADILRARAEAQVLAGSYAEAAAYFLQSSSAPDLLRAADAFAKAGMGTAARGAVERAIRAAAHARNTHAEAAARRLRAELARSRGREVEAEPDYRWLATHLPGTSEAAAAESALARPRPRPRVEGQRRTPTVHESAEDIYNAARALARAGRDDAAVKSFRGLAARFPESPFAQRASLQAARLELVGGQYAAAEGSFVRYLTVASVVGERRTEVEYEHGLALISSGHATEARRIFARLAERAPPGRSARLHELEALSAQRAGDENAATTLYRAILRTEPLTFAAIAARARLAELGEDVPAFAAEPTSSGRGARVTLELRLPPGPALLASIGLDRDAEAALFSVERETRASYPGRDVEALCGLYGMLAQAKRRYRFGIAALDAAMLTRVPGAADRWTWECVYPQPFAAAVSALERERGLPQGLMHAVMRQESGYDPVVVSPANAVGLMQLLPTTALKLASDLKLPYEEAWLSRPDLSLHLGAAYLKKLLEMFAANVVLAIAAYNAGPRIVAHWARAGGDNDLDLWVARIPYEETRSYVVQVVQNLVRYQYLAGGDGAVMPLALELPEDLRVGDDVF